EGQRSGRRLRVPGLKLVPVEVGVQDLHLRAPEPMAAEPPSERLLGGAPPAGILQVNGRSALVINEKPAEPRDPPGQRHRVLGAGLGRPACGDRAGRTRLVVGTHRLTAIGTGKGECPGCKAEEGATQTQHTGLTEEGILLGRRRVWSEFNLPNSDFAT